MKNFKTEYNRKRFFDSIINNYYNGNIEDSKADLGKLSKLDLIRFVNYLHLYIGGIYVDINGIGQLCLFAC